MALVTLPPILGIKRVQWTPQQPAQVNRSEWTGSRQVVQLPGKGYMAGSAEFVTLIGDAKIEALRGFLAATKGPVNQFAVSAVEAPQLATFPSIGARAAIANRLGTTISTNGRVITRMAAGSSWGGASADSATGFTSGAVLLFRSGKAAQTFVAGLNNDPATDSGYTGINHGWQITEANGRNLCNVMENGAAVTSAVEFDQAHDVFSIVYDNATVRYYRNGALIRSIAASVGQTLYFDCSIFTGGGVIADAIIYPLPAITAGVSAVTLSTILDGPAANALRYGWMATALIKGGGAQLVTLTVTADRAGDAAVATFEPPLRGAPYAFILDRPFALVARTGESSGWSVDPHKVYGASISFEEAF